MVSISVTWGGGGLEFIHKVAEAVAEAGNGFDFEDDGFGEQVMTDGVTGGELFTLDGDRTMGARAVSTGGVDLLLGSHCDPIMARAGKDFGSGGAEVVGIRGRN